MLPKETNNLIKTTNDAIKIKEMSTKKENGEETKKEGKENNNKHCNKQRNKKWKKK